MVWSLMKARSLLLAILFTLVLSPSALASTTVPGHTNRYDQDNNGYPDAGKEVNGHYTSTYTYDSTHNYYWDLGDGRVAGTVDSIEDLDQKYTYYL
jgi:hypothetical protein